MATFNTNGLDRLIIDLETCQRMGKETIKEMLMAGGEVIRKGHEAAMNRLFKHHDGGKFHGSSTIVPWVRTSGDSSYVVVYPKGEHHTPKKTGLTQYNNDVGFVLEFGGHGTHAKDWMRNANEQNIDKAVDAEYEVYDNWLSKNNL